MDRETIDNLHADIETWYANYLGRKEDGADNTSNEWYLQLQSVLVAAYGAD